MDVFQKMKKTRSPFGSSECQDFLERNRRMSQTAFTFDVHMATLCFPGVQVTIFLISVCLTSTVLQIQAKFQKCNIRESREFTAEHNIRIPTRFKPNIQELRKFSPDHNIRKIAGPHIGPNNEPWTSHNVFMGDWAKHMPITFLQHWAQPLPLGQYHLLITTTIGPNGQEEDYEEIFWGAWIPGLFHEKIADAHGTLFTHFGQPATISQNAWMLGFHNGCIDRLPITLTSLPTYHTSCDLIFISLYAHVLHCLLLVLKYESLEDKEDSAKPTKGDAVFENAFLFMWDALVSQEFNDAIKAGDSG
ncbi:uncharacterized protein LACBIDRAFT_327131 [Laccaria bicolor S238N-H82]|uniref:Predicted protein n=1 Tax=Laccaria bicolor (strain S238N-H82 / ATCC MYA-4686) TaxID=486041 RepID=B0DB97_LACBS|nr:uncharacterized protein LACBIDRAFT_327131 [Laccaria bicolor S238N-H82]EDR07951.1 predicted protein [Laccaria bicolor S238N-H82]|eukprot:XP_001881021.1 predicted protein [Laccaria bicolor S238N-H82]